MLTAPPHGYALLRPTLADVPDVVSLQERCHLEVLGRPETSQEEVLVDWTLPELDLQRDAWIVRAEASGELVAVVTFFAVEPPQFEFDGYVDPLHRGKGLGSLLVAHVETRAIEAAADIPAGHEVILGHGLFQQDRVGSALLRARGFMPVRTFFHMERTLEAAIEEPEIPDGVRLADHRLGTDDRAVWEALEEAFQDHWGSGEVSFETWRHDHLEHPALALDLWAIAWDGDQVAGAIITRLPSSDAPDRAWVSALGVRRPWRSRGLGRALLLEAFARTKARGYPRVGLGVDSENPMGALRLYEGAGMSVAERIDYHSKVIRPAGAS